MNPAEVVYIGLQEQIKTMNNFNTQNQKVGCRQPASIKTDKRAEDLNINAEGLLPV